MKLIDFGLAKSSARLAKSGDGIVKGKIPYLSPEQVEEKPIDRRIDIYALGATLWEMTTGRRLFKRDDRRRDDPRDPRARRARSRAKSWKGSTPTRCGRSSSARSSAIPRSATRRRGELARDLDLFLQKHGRKGELDEALAKWIEELFPGERAKQEAWLSEVSAVRAEQAPKKTMAPPAPVAEVPSKPEPEREKTVQLPSKRERHPLAALAAAGATVGFFWLLAQIFGRC